MNIVSKDITSFHCPRWNELPDVELYMDQVVSFIEKRLGIFSEGTDEKIATATMINNYVKQKIINPPIKKKYDRSQLAYLFIIFILKRVFSISEISDFIFFLKSYDTIENVYNTFCDELENYLKIVFSEDKGVDQYIDDGTNNNSVLKAAAFAFASKLYAQKVIQDKKRELEEVKK